MIKIAISSEYPLDDAETAVFLHKRLEMPLADAKARLAMGIEGLFYNAEIYALAHVDRYQEISDIIAWFNERDYPLFVMTLPEDVEWKDVTDWKDFETTSESLMTMLNQDIDEYE